AALAAFGIAVSGYLTWQWYEAASATWCDLDAYFSCSRIRESPWASIGGVPTAALGIGGFGTLLALSAARLAGRERLGPWRIGRSILALAGAGVAVGAALTLVELVVIQAVCILCAFAFALGVAVFAVAVPLARDDGAAG
ncbi:MAG: vitamin K epoxide reductase family protein, partial [Methanobacteriota archaeon]